MTLLFLESVGTTELLVIHIAALVLIGPRKLPELSRSLGKGLGEFKRASDEFKRTWEREVNLDSYERERKVTEAMLPPEERSAVTEANALAATTAADADDAGGNTISRDTQGIARPTESAAQAADANAVEPAPQSPHKADWL
ncbi:MAG: twin-arginine translocase TatA/TatE family subunit [Pyrinomonadaceae bacterium]